MSEDNDNSLAGAVSSAFGMAIVIALLCYAAGFLFFLAYYLVLCASGDTLKANAFARLYFGNPLFALICGIGTLGVALPLFVLYAIITDQAHKLL